jgi:hypothetical protein
MIHEYFFNSFSSNNFTEALSTAQELSELGVMIQGSLALAIHLYSDGNNWQFMDGEIDGVSPSDIRLLLRDRGYRDVPKCEYEKIGKKQGYSRIGPNQHFLYGPNGFIIDLSINKNSHRTTNIEIGNFKIKVITRDGLMGLYLRGSFIEDRPLWKRILYKLRYYQLKNGKKPSNYLNQMGEKCILVAWGLNNI